MPFKSEKQRRYLFANEPEIAKDWTDTYGSRIQKSKGGITQAGAINYEPSEMVSVPKEFRARAHSPNTHLAYITDDEAGILQALKPDTPHKGPRGIPNYDSFDADMNYTSGKAMSAAETGSQDPADKKEVSVEFQRGKKGPALPPGVTPKEAEEIRIGFIEAGGSPKPTDSEEVKKTKTKKDGWQIPSIWSPKTHYNLALNLPGAKKSRLANIKAYKDYLDAQGLDSSWIDVEDIGYEQWQEMKGFKPPSNRVDPFMEANLGITPDYFPQDYKNFMLTNQRNPNIFVSGDLGNFWNKPNPKGAINPDTGMPFTNTEWDTFKRGIIEDRGLSTGGDDYGGVPGAVPLGDMPLWQQQGFNSYEDWLATQGGGTTGGGTDGITTTQVANTGWPYKDYGTKDYQTSKTFMDRAYPGGYDFLLARGGRVPAAFGGIMDTETGRRGYFLGSIGDAIGDAVGGVAKAAGKVLKSPIGKAALLYGAGTYLGGMKAFGGTGTGGFFSRLKSPSNLANLFKVKNWSQGNLLNPLLRSYDDKLGEYTGLSPVKGIMSLSTLPFAMQALGIGQPKQDASIIGDRGGKLVNPLTGNEDTPQGIRTSLNTAIEEAGDDPVKLAAINDAFPFLNLGTHLPYPTYGVKDGGRIGFSEGGWDAEWDKIYEDYKLKQIKLGEEFVSKEEFIDMHRDNNAQGGRIGAQEGGLMDLGGMEKDYRNNGGFVAIGGEEKADDVPARLSRNEFVFTADAVRGAGGGDIDKGAEIMENVMKNLEQGGKISEETQGNTGAQEMFSVSERIGEVL